MRRRSFIVYKIIITLASFIFCIILKSNIDWSNLSKNYFDSVIAKEIGYDISMCVFSAMLMIWAVDVVNDYLNARNKRRREIEAICRFDKVFEHYVKSYNRAFYNVVVPIDKRRYGEFNISKQFTLKDMRDMHKSTIETDFSEKDSAVEKFFRCETELRTQIEHLLSNPDIIENIALHDICLDFLDVSLDFQYRFTILDTPNRKIGGIPKLEIIYSELANGDADKYCRALDDGKATESNIMCPYVKLHHLMCKEYDILQQYQNVVYKIVSNSTK